MKVLHILNELRPSGAEVMLECSARFWTEAGVDCEILTCDKEVGVFSKNLERAGYKVRHMPYSGLDYYKSLSSHLRSAKYDIVHQHAEARSYWVTLAALASGARCVRTVHSNFNFHGALRLRRMLQRRHLSRLGVKSVSISPSVQCNEQKRFGNGTELIWNWISPEFRRPHPEMRDEARRLFGYPPDVIVIGSVGNCSLIKNHDLIIRTLATIQDERLRYLHVGMEDHLHLERGLACNLGVHDCVTFAGWIPDPQTALAAMDLFIMPSLREGLGNSALEAIAAGVPTILGPGLPDISAAFPQLKRVSNDVDELRVALVEFIHAGATAREQWCVSEMQFSESPFTVSKGVDSYVELYRGLLSPRANK